MAWLKAGIQQPSMACRGRVCSATCGGPGSVSEKPQGQQVHEGNNYEEAPPWVVSGAAQDARHGNQKQRQYKDEGDQGAAPNRRAVLYVGLHHVRSTNTCGYAKSGNVENDPARARKPGDQIPARLPGVAAFRRRRRRKACRIQIRVRSGVALRAERRPIPARSHGSCGTAGATGTSRRQLCSQK